MDTSNAWQLFDCVAAGCFSQLALALGHFLWQGCTVAILYAIAARILRPAMANTRYLAGVAALLLMAACMPATLLLIPSAQTTPVLETNNRIDVAATSIEPFERVDEPVLAPEVLDSPAMQMLPQTIELSPAPPSAQESAENRIATITAWAWALPCTSVLYLCGVAAMLARVGLGLWGGRRLRRNSSPLTDHPIINIAADHARRMGMRAVPMIAACSRVGVPLVVGIFRPMILLPTSLISGLTSGELEALLVHELAHIRRFDPVVNVLQRLVEAMLFFHPAVWWVSRRVSTERENACDDLVLRANCGRDQYAQALVHMAELCMAAGNRTIIESSALAATGKNDSQFSRRVLRILNHGDKTPIRLTVPGIAISMFLILTLLLAPAAWRGIAWAEGKVEETSDESQHEQDNNPVSMSAQEFGRLSAEEQRALLARVFERRLEHANELLPTVLKARDDHFDNVALKVVVSGVKHIKPFPSWKFPGFAKKTGLEGDQGSSIKYQLEETLVVRESQVTYEKIINPEGTRSSSSRHNITPYQKWSNASGHIRDFTKDGTRQDQVMRLTRLSGKSDAGNLHRRNLELALGFGIGRWLKSIESLSSEGEQISLKGTFAFCDDEIGTFNATLDKDFIIRQGQLTYTKGRSIYRYEIETEGTFRAEEFACAKKGHFRITRERIQEGKDDSAKAELMNEFEIECKSVSLGLSDDEYKRLTQMPITPHMQVMDPHGIISEDIHNTVAPITDVAGVNLMDSVISPSERKKLATERKKKLDAVKQKATIRSADWKQVPAADAKLPPLNVSDLLREYDKVAAAGAELRSWEARCRVTSKRSNTRSRNGIPSFLNESDCYTTTHSILLGASGKKWFSERRQGNWQDEKIEYRRFCDGENVQIVQPAQKMVSFQPQSNFAEIMRVPESKCRPQLPVGFPPFLGSSLENRYPIPEKLPDVRKTLADPDAKVMPWRTSVDGHTCYVVELTKTTEQPMFRNGEELDEFRKKHPNRQVARTVNPRANPDDKRTEIKTIRLALDPQSGFMPARLSTKSEIIFTGELSRTHLDVEEILCGDFRKIDKQSYVAGRFQYTHYVNDPQGNISAIARQEVELEDFRANQDYGPDRFHFDPPKGYKVLDRVRMIAYSTDDSQEKIAAMLAAAKARKEFYEELKKKPAPSLQGAQWINSDPIRLEDLRGKQVRLHFSNVWCGSSVHSLSRLQQEYKHQLLHVSNPEVLIAIHPYVDGKELQKLKDQLRKMKITFPVMVDSRQPDNMAWGKTFADYRVYRATVNVWINPKGAVLRTDSQRAYIGENNWWMRHLAKKNTKGNSGGDNKPRPNENAKPPKGSQKKDNPPQPDKQPRTLKPSEKKKPAEESTIAAWKRLKFKQLLDAVFHDRFAPENNRFVSRYEFSAFSGIHDSFTQRAGKFQRVLSYRTVTSEDGQYVEARCKWEKAVMLVRLTFDEKERKITGFWLARDSEGPTPKGFRKGGYVVGDPMLKQAGYQNLKRNNFETLTLHVKLTAPGGKPLENPPRKISLWKQTIDPDARSSTKGELITLFDGTRLQWVRKSDKARLTECTFKDLTPGIYRVVAGRGNRSDVVSDPIRVADPGKPTTFTCEYVTPKFVNYSITLRLKDSRTGKPVEKFMPHVRFYYSNLMPSMHGKQYYNMSRVDGDWIFDVSVPVGSAKMVVYGVWCRLPNGDWAVLPKYVHEFDVPATKSKDAGPVDLIFDLETPEKTAEEAAKIWPWQVYGTVTDTDGRPLQGIEVHAHCGVGSAEVAETRTNAKGTYRLRLGDVEYYKPTRLRNSTVAKAWIHVAGNNLADSTLEQQGRIGLVKQGDASSLESFHHYHFRPRHFVKRDEPFGPINFGMTPEVKLVVELQDEQGNPITDRYLSFYFQDLEDSRSAPKAVDGAYPINGVPLGHIGRLSVALTNKKPKFNRSVPLRFTTGGTYRLKLQAVGAEGSKQFDLALRSATDTDGNDVLKSIIADGKKP